MDAEASIDGFDEESVKGRILLVDDEEADLQALAREPATAGYHAETCANPREALERLAREKYALIISDNQMPGLSGVALLEQVKCIAPDTLRFLLTGYADMDSAIRAIDDGGIHRYLTKPWQRKALHRTVREALDIWRLRADQRRLTEEVHRRNTGLVEVHRELRHLASRDRMTGPLNHAEFQHALRLAVATSRPPRPLWLGLADVDDFKAVNDTHGHPAGDAVPSGIAGRLRRNRLRLEIRTPGPGGAARGTPPPGPLPKTWGGGSGSAIDIVPLPKPHPALPARCRRLAPQAGLGREGT